MSVSNEMNRKKCLIVTSKDDMHADYVIERCIDLGIADKIVRFNTEDTLSTCIFDLTEKSFSLEIQESNKFISNEDILSVWYRRPAKPILNSNSDPRFRGFIDNQLSTLLNGIYYRTQRSSFWVNPLPAMGTAKNKIYQLSSALEVGLIPPDTLITNDPKSAMNFIQKHGQVCTKSLDKATYDLDGMPKPIFTSVIEEIEDYSWFSQQVVTCPIFFQAYIDKVLDIRVIVAGLELHAFEIHSQESENSKHDVRGVSPSELTHQKHKLPDSLEQNILKFVQQQGLVFSALDFVVNKKGEYIFLENNPNGQWLWLELLTSIDLTSSIIKLLKLN